MSNQTMNFSKHQKQRDPDLAGAEIAMQRAAAKARARARRTGFGMAIRKDGRVVQPRQEGG